jgi:hypothetical protein
MTSEKKELQTIREQLQTLQARIDAMEREAGEPESTTFEARVRRDSRFGGLLCGRNPKVLAKRRRQRERLAMERAYRMCATDVWSCSDGTYVLLSALAEQEATVLAPQLAERLHAIAEGRHTAWSERSE